MSLNFRSVSDLAEAILRNLHKIPEDIDLVIGIPRSGLMAANIVALELNLPITHVEGYTRGELLGAGRTRSTRSSIQLASESRHALLLDDSICSGESLREARHRIAQACPNAKVTTAAVYAAPRVREKVDVHFEVCPMPRIFGWNYMHRRELKNFCLDIDGVLCRDPLPEENDDGARYEEFLSTAGVLRLPTYEVGWLVTARLEKYRAQTEEWLHQHNVRYSNLIMLDGCTAEERRRSGMHGKFKASVYSSVNAELFVESSASQAPEIARLSGKQVLCVETQKLLNPVAISIPYAKQLYPHSKQFCLRAARKVKRTLGGFTLPISG